MFSSALLLLFAHLYILLQNSLVDTGPDIAVRFGGDCTKSALENRFRRLKSDAKLINDAVSNGIDPITINVGDTKGEAAMTGKGSTGQATNTSLHSRALCTFPFV